VIPLGDHQLDAGVALRHSLEGRAASARAPLFRDSGGASLTHAFLDRLFEDVIRFVLPAGQAADFSNHSFRIGCATTLLAAGFPLEVIKRFCRWRSDECAIIYSRAGVDFYAGPMAALRLGGVDDRVALAAEPLDIDADGPAGEAFIAIQALALAMAA
jgi:hypothetical protein